MTRGQPPPARLSKYLGQRSWKVKNDGLSGQWGVVVRSGQPGDTGIGEIRVFLVPGEEGSFAPDAAVESCIGTRGGVTGPVLQAHVPKNCKRPAPSRNGPCPAAGSAANGLLALNFRRACSVRVQRRPWKSSRASAVGILAEQSTHRSGVESMARGVKNRHFASSISHQNMSLPSLSMPWCLRRSLFPRPLPQRPPSRPEANPPGRPGRFSARPGSGSSPQKRTGGRSLAGTRREAPCRLSSRASISLPCGT